MRELTRLEMVYSNPQADVKVWKCRDDTTGQLVALKRQGFSSEELAEKAMREARIQRHLDHPCICKVLFYHQEKEGSRTYNCLATEWMDKKDLFHDITNRAKNYFPWKEEELWTYFRGLIDALALAQKQNTSHRNIKPQNIFINSANKVKIGDFGSAKEGIATTSHTLVGTPYFLSPLLRQSFVSGMMNVQIVHNPYKSDVFSLGMTFLYMAVLRPPIVESDVSEAAIFSVLQSIPYSDTLKQFLAWMLATEESNRPDFLQLNQWLNPTTPGIQETPCDQTGPIVERRCPACFVVFARPTPAWTAQIGGVPDYCSYDCYMIMSDMYKKQQEGCSIENPPLGQPETENQSEVILRSGFCTYCKRMHHDLWPLDSEHGVCSINCGSALVINTTHLLRTQPMCPQCQVVLSREVLLNFFESEEFYSNCYQTNMQKRCERCQGEAELRYFACPHSYCTKCYLQNIEETGGYSLCSVPGCQAPYICHYS